MAPPADARHPPQSHGAPRPLAALRLAALLLAVAPAAGQELGGTCDPRQGKKGCKLNDDHGECKLHWGAFTCQCKGEWSGDTCDLDPCQKNNDCGPHGRCRTQGDGHTCPCDGNWVDAHGGRCNECGDGWTGDDCEVETGCTNTPCGSHGTCTPTHGSGCATKDGCHSCNCNDGWEGPTCGEHCNKQKGDFTANLRGKHYYSRWYQKWYWDPGHRAKFVFHRAKLINYHKMIGVGYPRSYSSLMIAECKKLNMLPVCDYYSWCGLDKRSLYIGQRFHLADPAKRRNTRAIALSKLGRPQGFALIAKHWDHLCSYSAGADGDELGANCHIDGTAETKSKTPWQYNPGFICGRKLGTTTTKLGIKGRCDEPRLPGSANRYSARCREGTDSGDCIGCGVCQAKGELCRRKTVHWHKEPQNSCPYQDGLMKNRQPTLLHFRASAGFTWSAKRVGWDNSSKLCDWAGITCFGQSFVTSSSRGCQVVDGGHCAQSENYPGEYSSLESCVLGVMGKGTPNRQMWQS